MVGEIIEVVGLALGLTSKIMDKLPDYEQGKKDKFLKLKREYETEVSRDFPSRDDERIVILRRELLNFSKVFLAEISGPGV